MSDATARRVDVDDSQRSNGGADRIFDVPDGTHMLVEVEKILEAQKRTDALRMVRSLLNQPELERIICSARDELMRELGLEEVDGE